MHGFTCACACPATAIARVAGVQAIITFGIAGADSLALDVPGERLFGVGLQAAQVCVLLRVFVCVRACVFVCMCMCVCV